MAKITKKKPAIKTKKLTAEEKYWEATNNRARSLIAQQIVSQIPFNPNLVFELSEKMDNRYSDIIEEIQEYYADEDNETELPEEPCELAETIFIEYMTKLIADLRNDLNSWQ